MDTPAAEDSRDRKQSLPSEVRDLASAGYLAIRGKEECYRAHRYGRPLALVLVTLPTPDPALEARLQSFLRLETRASDITAYLGSSTYAALLPEADARAAASMLGRLLVVCPNAKAASGAFPEDGRAWDELFASVREKSQRAA